MITHLLWVQLGLVALMSSDVADFKREQRSLASFQDRQMGELKTNLVLIQEVLEYGYSLGCVILTVLLVEGD